MALLYSDGVALRLHANWSKNMNNTRDIYAVEIVATIKFTAHISSSKIEEDAELVERYPMVYANRSLDAKISNAKIISTKRVAI